MGHRSPLIVYEVNLYLSENSKTHHTNQFVTAQENLVVRRGQPFILRIEFDRELSDADVISLIFQIMDCGEPNSGHGTLVGVPVTQKFSKTSLKPNTWSASVVEEEDRSVTISVLPAATCPVYRWNLDIDTKLIEDSGQSNTCEVPAVIYILYNPWCKEDDVFYPKKHELSEYIENDVTAIWKGVYPDIFSSTWKLGQFEEDVLDYVFDIITLAGRLKPRFVGDPTRLSRALSGALNSHDDNGVMIGMWHADFPFEVDPSHWLGSVEILQAFCEKRKPVKYGQCWCYAGVMCTMARAIGIPARCITNYESAHDTEGSLTVDFYVDEEGNRMPSSDGIWNYHCWTELWMKRPDINAKGGYDGWQVLDGTPQITSDGIFQCGPSSVRAIKFGEIHKPYDVTFTYGELNADVVTWLYSGINKPLKLLDAQTTATGLLVCTKEVNSMDYTDITESYKHPEESRKERAIMLKALLKANSVFSRYYLNEVFNDVRFELKSVEDVEFGESFVVVLLIQNKSKLSYIANGVINAESVSYNGKNRVLIKKSNFKVKVASHSNKKVAVEVTLEEYCRKLQSQNIVSCTCLANVVGKRYEYYSKQAFRLHKPSLIIDWEGYLEPNTVHTITAAFKNPYPFPLHKCRFRFEGTGMKTPVEVKVGTKESGQNTEAAFQYPIPNTPKIILIAKFESKEVTDLEGYMELRL